MWIVFIIILVVVGLFAVWFNIWNHRNPVGKNKKSSTVQAPKSSEQEWMDAIRKNREEHERKDDEGLK